MVMVLRGRHLVARRDAARRGAALLESVLVFPLLAFFLVAMLFIGWTMQNRQQSEIAARLIGWAHARDISESEIPERYIQDWDLLARNHLMAKRNQDRRIRVSWVFGGVLYTGDAIEIDSRNTLEEWVDEVIAEHTEAGLGAEMWMLYSDHWDWGRGVDMNVYFPIPYRFWEHLGEGPYDVNFVRDGLAWRHTQIHNEQIIAEEFLNSVNSVLQSVEAPGDALAQQFRWMYRAEW
jgi:hypothetical protein